jgi:hypothetical protein
MFFKKQSYPHSYPNLLLATPMVLLKSFDLSSDVAAFKNNLTVAI